MRVQAFFTALAMAFALAGGMQSQHPEAVSLLDKPLYTERPRGDDGRKAEAAIAAARDAVAKDPSNVDAALELGKADEAAGRLLDAIDAYTLAIERHPDDARLLLQRGRLLLVIRKFDIALRDLRAAAPALPDARCRAAFVTYLKGEFARAGDAFKECPASPWAAVAASRASSGTPPRPPADDEMATAYYEALPALVARDVTHAREQLTRIVEKYRKRWTEDAYIAAEADLARLPKKHKKPHGDQSLIPDPSSPDP